MVEACSALGAGLRVALAETLVEWDCSISTNLVQGFYTRIGSGHSLIPCGILGGIKFWLQPEGLARRNWDGLFIGPQSQ